MAVTNKLEIDIKGKVFGFQNEGEDEATAIARILLEAEQHGNNGASRLHIEPTGTLPEKINRERCPFCQAKIDLAGVYWPTTHGNFCSKDHFSSWQDQQEIKKREDRS